MSVRTVARWLLAPATIGGASLLFAGAVARGVHPAAASAVVSVLGFAVVIAAEKGLPYREDWRASDGQVMNDLGHLIAGTVLGAGIGNAIADGAAAWVTHVCARTPGASAWPGGWPFALQVVLVAVLADLGRYVQHRMLHAVPSLWRFHELHHSTARLSVWKASRSHVTERIAQQVFMLGPVLALGAPRDVVLAYVVPNSLLGLFAHSNADVRFGPLDYVLMGPGPHRLHHSMDLTESNTNFGSAIVLWDLIFGTFTPTRVGGPEHVGIEGDPTPAGFWAQVMAPFRASGSRADV